MFLNHYEELKHFGIPGMKWGIRKDPERSGGSGNSRSTSGSKNGNGKQRTSKKKLALQVLGLAALYGGLAYGGAKFGGKIGDKIADSMAKNKARKEFANRFKPHKAKKRYDDFIDTDIVNY